MKKLQIHFVVLHGLLAPALLMSAQAACAIAPPAEETIANDADAAKPLERSYSFASDGTIDIENVRGSVVVTGGTQDQVTLGGNLGAGSKLSIEGSPRHLQLHVESEKTGNWFGGHGPDSDTNLILSVPHGVSIKLDVVSADSKVSGIDGRSLEIDSVSGRIVLNSAAKSIDVDSVSGDVSLQATPGIAIEHAHVQTVSGGITANGLSGRVKLETVSGRIGLTATEVDEFNAESVSGTIEATTGVSKGGRLHLETMSGNLRAHLPAGLSARMHAETFSGGLKSDFGTVIKAEFGPGSSLDARLGDSDARIEAQSFSGNVELRKQ